MARAIVVISTVGLLATFAAAVRSPWLGADQYHWPKALSLFLTSAGVAVALALAPGRRGRWPTLDALELWLLAALGSGALAAGFAVDNVWAALRAWAIPCAGVVLFVAVSRLPQGARRALLFSALLAAVVMAASVWLESFGVLHLSMPRRLPGGLAGHRNQAGHLLALSLPAFAVGLAVAPPRARSLVVAAMVLVASALALTRCRAAWLAAAAGMVVLAAAAALLPRERALRGALIGTIAALTLGCIVATRLPTKLHWESARPFRDTLGHFVALSEGSGAGRLEQYATTLRLALHSPLLGVGPGNWSSEYGKFASSDDHTYQPYNVRTTPTHPSSDWLALLAEGGLLTTLLVGAALTSIVAATVRELRADHDLRDERMLLAPVALLALFASLLVVSLLDAVVQLPAPTALVAIVVAAMREPAAPSLRLPIPVAGQRVALALVAAGLLAVAAHQLRLVRGADALARSSSLASWQAASEQIGDQPALHAELARRWYAAGDCARATDHALTARALDPTCRIADQVLERCQEPR